MEPLHASVLVASRGVDFELSAVELRRVLAHAAHRGVEAGVEAADLDSPFVAGAVAGWIVLASGDAEVDFVGKGKQREESCGEDCGDGEIMHGLDAVHCRLVSYWVSS